MKYRMRFAVLALAVVTAISLGAPASGDSQSPEQQAVRSYIYNDIDSPGGIGVINVWDGNYTYGQYDAILPRNQRTDGYPLYWTQAEGFYIGAGYCGRLWYWDGNRWLEVPATYWPGQHRVSQSQPGQAVARYWVTVFPQGPPGNCPR